MYEAGGRSAAAAKTTKSYLLDEKMYSVKTLALSVWKPDNERPGRHWVYMMRYATFLVEILEQTEDIEAIQILTRRVRKKPTEFYHHEHLWPIVCNAHLRMHRRLGNVVENIGDSLEKSMMNDDFGAMATQVEHWITSSAKEPNVLVDILKEMAELRRINANLMNASPIDKLCVDTYATLINNLGPIIRPPPRRNPSPALVAQPVLAPAPQVVRPPERVNPMSLNSLMNMDGIDDPVKAPPAAQNPAPAVEVPTKPKARLVSMREITKRAYDSVLSLSKPAAAPTGSSARKADATDAASTASNVRIVVSAAPGGANSPGVDTPTGGTPRPATPNGKSGSSSTGATGAVGGPLSTTRTITTTSLDNTADSADESELSDLPVVDEDDDQDLEREHDGQEGDEEDEDEDAEIEDQDMDADEGEHDDEHESRAPYAGLGGGSKGGAGLDGGSSDVEMGDGNDVKRPAAATSSGMDGWHRSTGPTPKASGDGNNAPKDAFSVLMKSA